MNKQHQQQEQEARTGGFVVLIGWLIDGGDSDDMLAVMMVMVMVMVMVVMVMVVMVMMMVMMMVMVVMVMVMVMVMVKQDSIDM